MIVLEKGRNHLLASRAAVRAHRRRSATTRSSSCSDTSSVPIRCSSRARSAAPSRTATAIFTGDVNNLPSTVGGGGFHADGKLPRFREVDFRAAIGAGPDRGRRRRRLAVRLRRARALLRGGRAAHRRGRRRRRQPVRVVARRARTRCRPGPTCSARCSRARPRTRLGYHPYRAPDRREQRRVRRPPGVQQLRVLRGSSAARSTPRATRSRRCAARCAPVGARSGPRVVRHATSLLDATGRQRARRALSRRAPGTRTR